MHVCCTNSIRVHAVSWCFRYLPQWECEYVNACRQFELRCEIYPMIWAAQIHLILNYFSITWAPAQNHFLNVCSVRFYPHWPCSLHVYSRWQWSAASTQLEIINLMWACPTKLSWEKFTFMQMSIDVIWQLLIEVKAVICLLWDNSQV